MIKEKYDTSHIVYIHSNKSYLYKISEKSDGAVKETNMGKTDGGFVAKAKQTFDDFDPLVRMFIVVAGVALAAFGVLELKKSVEDDLP